MPRHLYRATVIQEDVEANNHFSDNSKGSYVFIASFHAAQEKTMVFSCFFFFTEETNKCKLIENILLGLSGQMALTFRMSDY